MSKKKPHPFPWRISEPKGREAMFFCPECDTHRDYCKCEDFRQGLEHDIIRELHKRMIARINEECRAIASVGWGHRLAIKVDRVQIDKPYPAWTYVMTTVPLAPGQELPPGDWEVHSPWLVDEES